jgi:hypothetical protein
MIKELQKAQEKLTEKNAKGKGTVKKGAVQSTKEVVVTANNFKSMKKSDLDKALTFY